LLRIVIVNVLFLVLQNGVVRDPRSSFRTFEGVGETLRVSARCSF